MQQASAVVYALSALICYLGVLLSSSRTRLFIPVLLCLLLLFQLPGSAELVRIIIFSAAVGLAPKRRETATPLLILLALWACFLNGATVAGLLGRNFYSIKPLHIELALYEVTGFLLLTVLFWSRQFAALFGRLPRDVEISTVSFVLFLLCTLIGTATAFFCALLILRVDLATLLNNSDRNAAIITIATTALVAIPFTLSLALTRLLKDFARKLEQTLSTNPSAGPVIMFPKVVEFHDVFTRARELIDFYDHRTREIELEAKNRLAQKEEKEREHRQKLADSENLSSLLSLCPTGILAISGSGAILTLTPALESQFGFVHFENYVGRYYLELQPGEEASAAARNRTAVFLRFVSQLLSSQKDLARNQALRSFLNVDDKTLAEMTVWIFDERIVPVDWKRIAPQLPPSDVTIVIFSATREDQRKFLSGQLFPRTLEVIGGQCLETLGETSNLVNLLADKVQNAAEELRQNPQMQKPEMESLLRTLVRVGTDFTSEIKAILSEQLAKGDSPLLLQQDSERSALQPKFKAYSLTRECEELAQLFETLQTTDAELLLSSPEFLDPEGNNVPAALTFYCVEEQFREFKALFLSILLSLAKRAENSVLTLTIGSEQIGTGTAAMFRGSAPGRYNRIVLSHEGQSITTNMMPDSLQRMSLYGKDQEDLETALGFFSLKVERMKGFFSIQSSPAKGTHLTIYLPENPLALVGPLESLRKIPQTKVEGHSSSPTAEPTPVSPEQTRLLLVDDGSPLQGEVREALSSLPNLTLDFATQREALKIFTSEGASGIGFGSPSDLDDLFDESQTSEKIDLVILPIFGELVEAMRMLRAIGDKAKIIVISPNPEHADALSALHTVLPYPLEKDSLLSVILVNGLSQ